MGKHFELALSVSGTVGALMALRIRGGFASGWIWWSNVAVLGCRTTTRSVGRRNSFHLSEKSSRDLRSPMSSGDNRSRFMNASF